MKYYPIFVNLTGKSCIVVGGGDVGMRKVMRLLACGARVTVVSKTVTPDGQRLAETGRIRRVNAPYDAQQISEAFLVIGATDDVAVHDMIFEDCRRSGIMVNIVDDPARCDFILPSLCEQGDLSIAVSTGGKSPALAKKIRRELEDVYGPEYRVLLNILGNLRQRILSGGLPSEDNRIIFEALLQSPILEAIRREKWEQVKAIVKEITGLDMDMPEGTLR